MVCQRPLPQNRMGRVRTLAKELAEGAAEDLWEVNVRLSMSDPTDVGVRQYIDQRWNNDYPNWILLIRNDYLDERGGTLVIRKESFDLLEETEPSTIFISYRRAESSAFALLVLARLKQAGLEPFLDMALEPGEDWHAGLKQRIQSRDFFILLLGKTTLESPYVIKEIEWTLEKDLAIIPIWQPDFEFNVGEWPDLPAEVAHKLSNTHRIKVQDENPLEYDKALTELLNRFGITP